MSVFYCGPTGTGNGGGSDFNNLMVLPDATGFVRGNIYKIVEGSYGNRTLSTAASGSNTVTIRKVSAADSAVAGYSMGLHDGQAVFAGITIVTPYWVIDGMTRTETTRMEQPAGYGFRMDAIASDSLSGESADNSQISYADIGGPWSESASPNCSAPNFSIRLVYAQTGITFSRCVLHNSGVNNGAIAMVHGTVDLTFDHCDFYFGWGKATIATPNVGTTHLVVRYCRFWNSSQLDTCPAAEGPGLTCEIGSYSLDEDHVGHLIHGNIIYNTTAGGRNASIMFGEPLRLGQARNCKVFNNTFAGFPESSVLSIVYLKDGTGNEVRDNLFWDIVGPMSITANVATNNVDAESSPFVDYLNRDFRLAVPIPGMSLDSPYERDLSGALRGEDGVWDVGAFEFDAVDRASGVVGTLNVGSLVVA